MMNRASECHDVLEEGGRTYCCSNRFNMCIHLCTSAIATSLDRPVRFPPHKLNRSTRPAVNNGSYVRACQPNRAEIGNERGI